MKLVWMVLGLILLWLIIAIPASAVGYIWMRWCAHLFGWA